MSAAADLLVVDGIDVSRGGAHVLFNASLRLRPNEIVACVGRNGAGKSTLLQSIAGFLRLDRGSIHCDGQAIDGRPPYEVARGGVRYVPQDKSVFTELTVRENLELGSYATGDHDWAPVLEFFPKLKVLMDRKAGHLSGGERQMLMIGRAILGDPKVLLIDEPTEGLSPLIVQHLRSVFTELSRRCAVLIVEQNLPLVCAIAERVYGVREGCIVAELKNGGGELRPEHCEPYL